MQGASERDEMRCELNQFPVALRLIRVASEFSSSHLALLLALGSSRLSLLSSLLSPLAARRSPRFPINSLAAVDSSIRSANANGELASLVRCTCTCCAAVESIRLASLESSSVDRLHLIPAGTKMPRGSIESREQLGSATALDSAPLSP